MTLRTRLVLAFAYILLAVIVALTVPLALNLSRRAQSEIETDTLLAAQKLAAYIGAENMSKPRQIDEIVAGAGPEIERVVVTALDGTVVYDSDGEAVGENFDTASRPEIQDALRGIPTADIRFSRTEGRDLLVGAAPVIDEQQVGAIRLTRDFSRLDAARRRSIIGLIVIGLAALGAGILIAFGLAGSISQPVRQLAGAANRLGEGDLTTRAGEMEGGTTEVKELAANFDEMADRLERTVQAQREFVANASHQLRTPLTGMKLRLEGAIAAAPNDDTRRQLEAADREVDRLSEIVDRLLMMAHEIEQGIPTRVDLGDAAQRAVERWHERAERLDSSLRGNGGNALAQGNPTDVDQILDNLLDNAMAYAPGAIEIETGAANGTAWVAVRDHGPGIPRAEQPRVIERFYRGRGAPQGGSGLGLAIATELAQKWGGSLAVSSPDDGGTRIEVRFRAAADHVEPT
ncbi:MAG: ATP-binding protein [Actinomycetota bacterium]